MELHDTPMLRYLGQLSQPDLVPAIEPTLWLVQYRDGGWPLPMVPSRRPVNRLTG